ncbi:mitochondrial metalloendopeptidase OMA1-like protein isoform X2 [Tanacetum coccineum]
MGESHFKKLKANTYKGKFLPATHPHSVRVMAISKNIIKALQSELKIRNAVLDDMSTGQSTNKGKYKREHSAIDYLLGLKWEVMVVNDENVNAFCVPGGKIVVFTGLLKYFTTDEEIATVIGHELNQNFTYPMIFLFGFAQAVARQQQSILQETLVSNHTKLILYPISLKQEDAVAISDLMESEADYIGLMLMASAGYDPRLAPKVYEKLSKVGPQIPSFLHYLTTHPSGKNRSKALSKAWVMQEALSNYRETKKR